MLSFVLMNKKAINLSTIGRVFYGIAIAEMGFQTIYSKHFPYMLIPPTHFSMSLLAILTYTSGALLMLAGICIAFNKKIKPISLLLGFVLLLIFCFYFIPYQFIVNPNHMQFGEWENAEKELALAGGAFVIDGFFSEKNETSFIGVLTKLIPFGAIIFSLTMICFGISHFLYPNDVADYIPAWIPFKTFWTYFAGTALIGSGIAIILKIKPRLFATLLGIMIFTWFIILHIPKTIASASMGGEVTSAFLALAYSGIAFVISRSPGRTK
jgi:uncharacterized membrane protein YphA (DoxX/SURF4 family)